METLGSRVPIAIIYMSAAGARQWLLVAVNGYRSGRRLRKLSPDAARATRTPHVGATVQYVGRPNITRTKSSHEMVGDHGRVNGGGVGLRGVGGGGAGCLTVCLVVGPVPAD